MSVIYTPVQWTRAKWIYDAVLVLLVGVYLGLFLHVAPLWSDATLPTDTQIQRMRATGSCAFYMLTAILCIGPLARLDRRFLPLLYNRRHFGVLTCLVALTHAGFVLDWYFAFSPIEAEIALLGANTSFGRLIGFPFEALGILALLILAVLAATSHDFWLSFLTPPVWKRLHGLIYLAYAAVVGHVALGALQDQDNPVFAMTVGLSVAAVVGLHLAAARRPQPPSPAEWVRVARPEEIAEETGRAVTLPSGDRAAVFRHQNRFHALSNACAHQNGPLGEGRVICGLVTCPWHGFQYRLEDGCSPAPFTERVPTYRLKIEDGALWIDPQPNPPGTALPGVPLPEPETAS
ncbi:MAG: Rieske 2Fe-2S domain-containing protein [Paracoccaceae bacterium]